MELQFEKTICPCCRRVLGEVRSLEQAQEIRLSDGMPDIGKVLCSWGQVLQRGKEWTGDSVSLSAGMLVWVLYAPEDGTPPRSVEGWIPFTASWDLPQTAAEGKLRFSCRTRFVDARSVSARKLLVRAGMSVYGEAYVRGEAEVFAPQAEMEGVELKKVRYPLRLYAEAGEKTFSLEESLPLPGTLPALNKFIYCTLEPEIQEQRVMADKVVFRGSARLHVLYETPENTFQSWEFSLPFSQFAELEESRSGEAEVSLVMGVTALETEKEGEGIHVRCSLTAQYLVEDQQMLELVQDAYSPGRELTLEQDSLSLSGILERRRESLPLEQTLPLSGETGVDVTFLPDFPRERTVEGGVEEELTGVFQVLYTARDGSLEGTQIRWEGKLPISSDPACRITVLPQPGPEPQLLAGGGEMKLRGELPLEITTLSGAGIPMVTGLSLGEEKQPEADRPSLILCRMGEGDLWDLAKACGSTLEAIRSANHLKEDPPRGKMLLIPIL